MAAPARAKNKSAVKPKTTLVEAPLESVYEELVEMMLRHAPPFRTDIACMSGGKNEVLPKIRTTH